MAKGLILIPLASAPAKQHFQVAKPEVPVVFDCRDRFAASVPCVGSNSVGKYGHGKDVEPAPIFQWVSLLNGCRQPFCRHWHFLCHVV